ncbi:MAG TPA: GNAT family N-acetyltransferase [Acidimicrobiia bacterium]
MDATSLRSAKVQDREFLFELHRAAMGPYLEELFGPWDDAIQWEFFDRWFQRSEASVVVLEGEDIGVLGLEHRVDEVYVTRIEIHPDWQNRGIGSAVMQQVLDQAAVDGKAVSLHVFEINPAFRLYERLGFATAGKHEDRILMKVRPT